MTGRDIVYDLVVDVDERSLKGITRRVEGGTLIKEGHTPIEIAFLMNHANCLWLLRDCPYTPNILHEAEGVTHETYLGESEPVTDETAFRHHCINLLLWLNSAGVRHGDLTRHNVIVKDNKPMLVDFHQSRYAGDGGPDKRPEGDHYWMWETAAQLSPDSSRHIRKWAAIRPHLSGATVVDYGCAEGDYLRMAAVEPIPYFGRGYDTHPIRATGPLAGQPITIFQEDILGLPSYPVAHNALFMSVYPHIWAQAGQIEAESLFNNIMEVSGQVFFETQLAGDGPGLGQHQTHDDVGRWLLSQPAVGSIQKLIEIPVHGRDITRAIWLVKKP